MPNTFCTQCGASLLADARFCVECGASSAGAPAPRPRRLVLQRYAPVLVVATVLLASGAAVFVGAHQAKEPPRVPARAAQRSDPRLPEGHPPVALPDDVRDAIRRKADEVAANPGNVTARKQLALMQYRAGLIEPPYLTEAVKTYEAVLAQDPKDADALRALGDIAVDGNDPKRAMEYYQRFLEIRPEDPYVHTLVGNIQLAARNAPEAKRSYEAALAADPMLFQAQVGLGFALAASGEPAAAMDALRKARGLATDDASRRQVDDLIARITAPRESAAKEAGADFKTGVESIFRTHQIVGPKVDRIEWPDESTVEVVLREFPVEAMPPFARDRLTERITTELRENKGRYGVTRAVTVKLVDAASGRVMDTIAE